jgi:hypothetical protein
VSECKRERRKRCSGRRRELSALSFAFAYVSASPPLVDEFRARV